MHSILAARTDFSIGESILSVEALVENAKALGTSAVAITDTMSVTAMIDFSNRCKKAGLKPIIGTRLRISDDPAWRPAKGEKKKTAPECYMTVYALNEAGMTAIFRLLSRGWQDDRYYYTAKLAFSDLLEELDRVGPDALALTTGNTHGMIASPHLLDRIAKLRPRCNRIYAELLPVDTPYFTRLNQIALDLVDRGLVQPLTVRPAFYETDGADAHEIMAAITVNVKIADGWHKSTYNRDFHLVGAQEMLDHTRKAIKRCEQRGMAQPNVHFRQGLLNTADLVNAITYEWKKAPVSLPRMAPDEYQAVVDECKKGWVERFTKQVFGHQPTKQELDEVYMPRLKYELSILQKLEFSGYFLLVQDVVHFAKSNGILVGPGRGSVGGSLVAYLMGITDCDPIRFGLLFERFINPDRIDLPDADLDFMSTRRHEVVEYLVSKYGSGRVAGVSNFGTLAAASSIRDVGRVAGLAERDYACSKYVPKLHGANVPLLDCAEQVPEIKEFALKHDTLWPIMLRLEGTNRSFSQHAAGIVVGGCDLTERAVIEKRKDSLVVNWDKRIVEDQGLVKIDILGLSTLDLIALTLSYIRERHTSVPDLMRIPLDDAEVLENFAKGNTTGVFQFESGGMRRLLKELGADDTITFEDITAATALYRPGPMESGMMDSYYLRKQGNERVEYDHPRTKDALKSTYGVLVYQEQLMKISRDLCGFTGSEADVLRKAMGKKDPALMAAQKEKFVEGAVAGYANVTLEDGSVVQVHLKRKLKVKESDEKFTITEIMNKGYSLAESL